MAVDLRGGVFMRNKILIFSLLAVAGVTVLAIATGATVFALSYDVPIQTEQVTIDQSIEVSPVEVEPVKVVEPVLKLERAKYAGYDGDGNCPYSHSKAQLVEAPAQDEVVNDQLLTLAE